MLMGWTTASRGFIAKAGKLSALGVDSETWREAAKLSVRKELARSADGTMVPMVIIGQGKATGPQPTLIESYGSYGAYTTRPRSEEHTSELQSLMRSSYAAFGLKKQ